MTAIYFAKTGLFKLGHGVLLVLPHDSLLMLSQAMDSIVPGLPVVLGQHVGCGAHLAGDEVLDPRPGVGGALQPRLGTSPARKNSRLNQDSRESVLFSSRKSRQPAMPSRAPVFCC